MRDLFARLNGRGISVDISTFSKANQTRSSQIFKLIYEKLLNRTRRQIGAGKYDVPIDSTSISLTSKLFWSKGYHQVKLFGCFDQDGGGTEGVLINFGDVHDYNYVKQMTEAIPKNAVGVMDRGFASLSYIKASIRESNIFCIED